MSATEPNRECTRRSLIQCAATVAGASALAGCATQTHASGVAFGDSLAQDDVVLFQGDSITDAGRDKKNAAANDFGALGRGYANMIASALLGAHAPLRLRCYNRGISGHKVPDLQARWQADTINLKPAVLSILIGVNDMWHKLAGKYDGTVADYEQGFTKLLADTRAALPKTRIVICEPFVLACGAVNAKWFPEFAERRAVAKRVAEGAGATWVPFQTMFDEAVDDTTPPTYWAGDGVHPTMAGHALMAKTWLDATRLAS
ncbi:MAG: SGNH/GDSL hydrolase family protein [bacterium]|nr:SGNH/GDSL hydrolase family protein [bacterium]